MAAAVAAVAVVRISALVAPADAVAETHAAVTAAMVAAADWAATAA